MKKLLLTTLIGSCLIVLNAQEKPIAKIHYIFTHVNDTTKEETYLKDEVVTYLGLTSSYYTSYSSVSFEEQMEKMMNAADFDGQLLISRSTSPIKESYFLEPLKSSLVEIRNVATDEFLIKTSFTKQIWDIHEDTKVIGGYTCQKASTTFGGRNYTAWFTLDIPFAFGPWKLHGLPGLILQAVDERNEVTFEYAGFDKLSDSTQIFMGIPENAIFTRKQEVDKLAKAFESNRAAYLEAKADSKGTKAGVFVSKVNNRFNSRVDPNKIKSISIKNDDDYTPSSVTNNPLELNP